jgi:hypothetical protein
MTERLCLKYKISFNYTVRYFVTLKMIYWNFMKFYSNRNDSFRFIGKPLPSVKWFLNLTMIDDNYSVKTNQNITIVENELILKRLTRNQLFSSLKCLSSNSNLTQSISQTITIDINCKSFALHL